MGVLLLHACAKEAVVQYRNVPALTPGTRAEMNTPGFWIGRHASPDTPVMTGAQIESFNAAVRQTTRAVYDLTGFSATRSGTNLRSSLKRMLESIASRNYVTRDGQPVGRETLGTVEHLMALDAIPETVSVHWAYVVMPCDQRLLPVEEPYYKSTTDIAIDRLQNNALDLATPLVVLHASTDGKWLYAICPYSEGWVKAESVALCPREEMQRYEAWDDFVVATAGKADLYDDPFRTRHHTSVHMGVRLPLLQEADRDTVQVLIPVRTDGGWCVFDAAYASAAQVHRGYLPCTPRTAITQAFRLLNTPYGWGGMYGEQDCSRFVQEIFACMGILMPRNSGSQAKVGRLAASFGRDDPAERRREALVSATGGLTTLQFPGHIMLYLGEIDGEPYAIHDLYAYTEPVRDGDDVLVPVSRVAVTSLAIGEGTQKGSLLMRLVNVREIAPYAMKE
ncbi:MAG TPA: SH3 domain-containing protein [Deltaproteobacteria bacterium]|nr:SH3 domain-containing protein [Deltaproteobacteria bacterium]HQI81828.1 SH3 domain-containing protein [Deltaproteobacteria bacterium]